MSFLGSLASVISEGIEEGRIEAQRRAAEKAEYQSRLDKVTAQMDEIVAEGVRKGFVKRRAVAYHFCPELRRVVDSATTDAAIRVARSTTTYVKEEPKEEKPSEFQLMMNPDCKYEGLIFDTCVEVDHFMKGLGYKEKSLGYNVRLYEKDGKTATAQKDSNYDWKLHF